MSEPPAPRLRCPEASEGGCARREERPRPPPRVLSVSLSLLARSLVPAGPPRVCQRAPPSRALLLSSHLSAAASGAGATRLWRGRPPLRRLLLTAAGGRGLSGWAARRHGGRKGRPGRAEPPVRLLSEASAHDAHRNSWPLLKQDNDHRPTVSGRPPPPSTARFSVPREIPPLPCPGETSRVANGRRCRRSFRPPIAERRSPPSAALIGRGSQEGDAKEGMRRERGRGKKPKRKKCPYSKQRPTSAPRSLGGGQQKPANLWKENLPLEKSPAYRGSFRLRLPQLLRGSAPSLGSPFVECLHRLSGRLSIAALAQGASPEQHGS